MKGYFPKKAMILAAGYGKRMRSHDDSVPKPLVQVGGKPLIDWSLDLVQSAGINEVVVNTSYMADVLEAYLSQRASPTIIISREEGEPLETGGGIKNALPLLGDEPFFVLNSDVISLNGARPLLQSMAERWDPEEMDGLMLMASAANASGYYGRGDFSMGAEGVLQRRGEHETVPFIFAGIQLLHPRIFNDAPDGAFSMNVLYNKSINPDRTLPYFRGIAHEGVWLHVGDGSGKASAEKRLHDLCVNSA
ncbi:MAG: nucleotidyltransferase family protein [Alphaproteobacteria bacterium]|nr:nucleotidyltransferase family protein [Alphaproteobacteria bacterium]